MNASREAMFAAPVAVIAAIAVFGIPSLVHAGSSPIQIAADNSNGSYGSPNSDTRPGDANMPANPANPADRDTTSGNTVDDSMITAKVKSALISDDEVKAFDINVRTRKGEVVLTGMVDNQEQIDRAVQLASNVEGVASVSNRLTVKK